MHIPNLGVLYLAARLESLGHETMLFDLNADELPQDGKYDQLWLSSTAPQRADVVRVAQATQGWQTRRVLGGPAAWTHPDAYSVLGFDLVAAGECDTSEAVQSILERAERREGNYAYFPVQPTLDWVLPPVRRWNDRYHANMKDARGNQYRMTSMFTSRGCPMSCAFCDSGRLGKIWEKAVRYEPLAMVEQQIAECAAQGFTGLMYYDDIMPLSKQRTLDIMRLHRKYGMVWRGFMRSDILCKYGEDFFKALVDGGLIEFFVGVESADNRIKAGIHKSTTIEEDEQLLSWARKYGVRAKTSFILGLPGESQESMEATRRWILKHRPERVQIGRLIPLRGTPLTDHPEQYDLTYERQPPDEWFYAGSHGEGTHSFVSTSHLTVAEIDAFWHKLMDELKAEGISA